MSSANWRPFFPGGDELKYAPDYTTKSFIKINISQIMNAEVV